MQHLLLINGLPGSGKTTISRILCETLQPAAWVDTDDLMHVKPWINDERKFADTLRRGILVVKDFFDSGIPTVVLAGCVHSKELFRQVANAYNFDTIRCTYVALLTDPLVRQERQQGRGKKVDVGTDAFGLQGKDVTPTAFIRVDSTEQTPEETARMILAQIPR